MSLISLLDEHEWSNLLTLFPKTSLDVYFTPEYATLYESGTNEGKVRCIKFENSEGFALYPYIEREIPLEITNGKKLKDIVTPYGYGGPVLTNRSQEFLRSFNNAVDDFFMDMGYISEFIRFHPILENHKLRDCTTSLVHRTFGVDFSKEEADNLEFWHNSMKRGVKKAEKSGLEITVEPLGAKNLDTFVKIYNATMKRRNARPYYFFSESYWSLMLSLGQKGESILANVLYNGKVISSAIFLIWDRIYIHYHLGGSNEDYLNLRPNNYLFWNIEKWAAKNKFRILFLGGGVKESDGLERFKSGISNVSFDFYVGKKVFNEKIFHLLNERAKRLSEQNYDADFFPPYRSVFR